MAAIFPVPYEVGPDRTGVRRRPRPRTVVSFDPGHRGTDRSRHDRDADRLSIATVLVALAVLAVTVLGFGVVFAVIDAASQPPTPAAVTVPAAAGQGIAHEAGGVIVVQAGDTLTSIARQMQPTGDVSALVDRLAALHGPAPLQAGERLAIGSLGAGDGPGR